MGFRELIAKSQKVLEIEVAGEKLKFAEISAEEEASVIRKAREEYKEKHKTSKDDEVDDYAGKYLTWYRLTKGGEDIEQGTFFSQSGFLIDEITMSISFKLREAHPGYYQKLEALQSERKKRVQELLKENKLEA